MTNNVFRIWTELCPKDILHFHYFGDPDLVWTILYRFDKLFWLTTTTVFLLVISISNNNLRTFILFYNYVLVSSERKSFEIVFTIYNLESMECSFTHVSKLRAFVPPCQIWSLSSSQFSGHEGTRLIHQNSKDFQTRRLNKTKVNSSRLRLETSKTLYNIVLGGYACSTLW